MKTGKCNTMRALNDVLSLQPDEQHFINRLYCNVYTGVLHLYCYMSKTMHARIFDIAKAITTIVIYHLYGVDGRENEQHAQKYVNQFKSVRVLCDNLCECLSIHDLPDEILNKVETTGKPLFNFINKNY